MAEAQMTYAPGRAKNVPTQPTFATFAEERRHRKERLAAAFRLFSRFGYDEGVAGHITARDPEYPDHFWVNPFGVHFGQIRVSDLVLVDAAGEVVEGNYPVNTSAFAIHSRVHAARPEAVAAAHAHSIHGKAWSSLGRLLDPITQDACAFYEDHGLFDDFTGVVYETSEGDRIAQALGSTRPSSCAITDCSPWARASTPPPGGSSRWSAAARRSCSPKRPGKPIKIAHEYARLTHAQVGNEYGGWFQFQPLWQKITREEPDLFE